jgi:hypothetical protein
MASARQKWCAHAAGELFDLSFPCAFGQDVPDGFIALDREDELTGGESQQAAQADLGAAALVTFDTDADGYFAVRRSDAQWIAAGLSALLECNIKAQATIINTLPLNSLAGIGAAFIPWLLSGGTLELVHGHAPEAVRSAAIAGGAHLVAPAAALPDLPGNRHNVSRPASQYTAAGGGKRSISQTFLAKVWWIFIASEKLRRLHLPGIHRHRREPFRWVALSRSRRRLPDR